MTEPPRSLTKDDNVGKDHDNVVAFGFSPAGNRLAVQSDGHTIKIFSAAGVQVCAMSVKQELFVGTDDRDSMRDLDYHPNICLSFIHDGSILAFAGRKPGSSVYLAHSASGKLVARIKLRLNMVLEPIAWHPDCKQLFLFGINDWKWVIEHVRF